MVDEIIAKIGDQTISIDLESKTIDIENNRHYIFIDFEDLDDYIEALQKIKEKIKEV